MLEHLAPYRFAERLRALEMSFDPRRLEMQPTAGANNSPDPEWDGPMPIPASLLEFFEVDQAAHRDYAGVDRMIQAGLLGRRAPTAPRRSVSVASGSDNGRNEHRYIIRPVPDSEADSVM